MAFKIVAGIIGIALLTAFVGPVIYKLKEISLVVVALIGITMAIVDFWQALRSQDE
jgi:hypothetical protein